MYFAYLDFRFNDNVVIVFASFNFWLLNVQGVAKSCQGGVSAPPRHTLNEALICDRPRTPLI